MHIKSVNIGDDENRRFFLPFCPKSITAIEFLQYASLYRQPTFSQTKWPPTFVNKLLIVNFFNPLLIFVKLNRNLTDYSHIFNKVLRYYKRNRNCYESFTLSQMKSLLYFSTWFQYSCSNTWNVTNSTANKVPTPRCFGGFLPAASGMVLRRLASIFFP